MPPEPSAETQVLVRGIRVLEALAGMEQPASLPLVVERVGLPRTQVYRTLRALQDVGYVDHAGRRGYRIAARGLSLGSLLSSRPELRDLARPVLARLAAASGAVATFHLRSGADRVLILAAAPPHRAHVGSAPPMPLGERSPLVRGCSGRAILAHLPGPDVEGVIADGPAGLRAELTRIAEDGVALSFGDNHVGHHGVAAAVLDPEDRSPLGSLTLSGDADHFDEPTLVGLAATLRAAAARMAPALAAFLGVGTFRRRESLDVGVGHTRADPAPGEAGSDAALW